MIIKKLPKTISAQRVYNHVKKHLLKDQKERCVSGGRCRYRLRKQGKVLACAVGSLIPDSHYSKKMEQASIQSLRDYELLPEPLIKHVELLDRLQHIHDCRQPEEWAHCLENAARERDLKP